MADLSEIEQVDSRLGSHVDKLVYKDSDFLRQYDAYSFCSTAQVQNGNINQLQGSKVVGQNSLVPVQIHEMQEPLIQRVVFAQTSTADGL